VFERILVPTDGRRRSRAALRAAAALAAETGAALTVVTVVNPIRAAVEHALVPVGLPEDVGDVRAEVARIVERLRAEGAPKVETLILEGDIKSRILGAADSTRADLIIMGRSDGSRAERLLLGSVLDSVVADARCPVLIVPGDG
jgi:nucleotide-binding universal stress UspA family protein